MTFKLLWACYDVMSWGYLIALLCKQCAVSSHTELRSVAKCFILPDCHGFCSCPSVLIQHLVWYLSGTCGFYPISLAVDFFLGCLVSLRLLSRASMRKFAGVFWSRKAVCADQDRRLRGSEFLPTHCSHNVDRKRDLYDQCSLNGFSYKRCFWPGCQINRVTGWRG